MGRCNTRSEPQVQEFQGLRIIREHKSKEKASCLGKSELQPKGSVRLKRIARSIDQRVLHRPFEPAALSLTRPAVARVFSYVLCRIEHTSSSAHELRLFLEFLFICVHPQLLSLLRSSTWCCPPVISSITWTTMSFSISPFREAGSLITQPVTFAP